MADTSGMSEIRGINIDKTLRGFAEEDFIFKNELCEVSTTSAREIRWYQKTSGVLAATSPATIANVSQLSKPFVLEQSFTRNTSYVKKFFVESPMISMEDIKDNDVDILAWNLRDLTRAIASKVDARIWDVITENRTAVNINSVTSTAAWDAASGQDPIEDISDALQKIKESSYNADNAVILLSPKDEKNLITWLISSKGSSIPSFSSKLAENGSLLTILGKRILVSNNVTADYAAVVVPKMAATWKEFTALTGRSIEEPGIGTFIRVWEEGECLLHSPKCVTLISNTQT